MRCVVRTDCLHGKASLVKLTSTSMESRGPGSGLDSLYVTAWHPVEVEGQWVFPGTVCAPVIVECEAVYSFLVTRGNVNVADDSVHDDNCDRRQGEGEGEGREEGCGVGGQRSIMRRNAHQVQSLSQSHEEFSSSITVNGIKCVTLAHGIKGSEVLSHPFYGTLEVVNALKKCRGWKTGLVRFGTTATVTQQCYTRHSEGVQNNESARSIVNKGRVNEENNESETIHILSKNNRNALAGLDGYSVEYGRYGRVGDFVVRDAHTGLVNGFMLSSEI